MSLSASSTELILTIAAAADCIWLYTSDSSCSGWNTSCSRYMAVISVPMLMSPST